MKIRNGFVSNSSSSSFCIYGIPLWVSNDEFDELYHKIEEDEVASSNQVRVFFTECGNYAIGRSYQTIRDNETGGEFRTKTKKIIEDFMGVTDINCQDIQEEWIDA